MTTVATDSNVHTYVRTYVAIKMQVHIYVHTYVHMNICIIENVLPQNHTNYIIYKNNKKYEFKKGVGIDHYNKK